MKTMLFHATPFMLFLIGAAPAWLLSPLNSNTTAEDVILAPQAVSGNTECAAASASTSLFLSFVSYGNYTVIPGQGDEDGLAPRQLMSMSFAVYVRSSAIYSHFQHRLRR